MQKVEQYFGGIVRQHEDYHGIASGRMSVAFDNSCMAFVVKDNKTGEVAALPDTTMFEMGEKLREILSAVAIDMSFMPSASS